MHTSLAHLIWGIRRLLIYIWHSPPSPFTFQPSLENGHQHLPSLLLTKRTLQSFTAEQRTNSWDTIGSISPFTFFVFWPSQSSKCPYRASWQTIRYDLSSRWAQVAADRSSHLPQQWNSMMLLFSALQTLLFWWANYFFMQLAIVHSLINMQSENFQLSKIKFMSKMPTNIL